MKIIPCLFGVAVIASITVSAQDQRAAPGPGRPVPEWLSGDQMHADYLERVIKSPGFGASRMPQVFQSVTELKVQGTPYYLSRVGLIGIAEHPAPVAFISPTRIPSLRDLTNATFRAQLKTRALTAFETNALPKLSAGREVVADLQAGRVVGAVRAREECLKCHEGKVGTLLGALSYEMTPGAKSDSVRPGLVSQLENLGGASKADIAVGSVSGVA